jgi:hypothetical protein
MNARDKKTVDGLRDVIAQLRLDKVRLLQLIAAAPVFLNRQLQCIRINAALKVMDCNLGNEHIGHTLREVIPEQASTLEPLCRKVLQSQTPILNVQIGGLPGHGRAALARVYLVSICPVRADDKTLNLALIIRDVSSYKVETIRDFNSLMTKDFSTVLFDVAGGFDAMFDSPPETHTSFTWLKKAIQSNEKGLQLIRHLLVLAGNGGPLMVGRDQPRSQLITGGESAQPILPESSQE